VALPEHEVAQAGGDGERRLRGDLLGREAGELVLQRRDPALGDRRGQRRPDEVARSPEVAP